MKILLVDPGATYSITEVYQGLSAGLVAAGHEVHEFETLARFRLANKEHRWMLSQAGMKHLIPKRPKDDQLTFDFFLSVREEVFKEVIWQVLDLQVDWLVMVSPLLLPARSRAALEGLVARTCMVFTESPYDDDRQARLASYASWATTNDRASAQKMQMPYLPMGWVPELHWPRDGEPTEPLHDVVLVGAGFPERVAFLEAVDWSGINLGLYGDWRRHTPRRSPLWAHIHEGVIPNHEAVRLYKSSLVGLNLHRTCADYWRGTGKEALGGWSINPRGYELAACAVPQVSDWRPGLVEVFGEQMARNMAVDTPERLGYAVRALLDSAKLRQVVAAEQHEAVAAHSYHHRALTLSGALEAQEVL